MIKLGSIVEDVYTGFKGIAVSRTDWLYGCSRIGVEPTNLKDDGTPHEMVYFDEQRLNVCNESAPIVSTEAEAVIGGDKPNPVRYKDPLR